MHALLAALLLAGSAVDPPEPLPEPVEMSSSERQGGVALMLGVSSTWAGYSMVGLEMVWQRQQVGGMATPATIAAGITGVLLGPSTGHLYAGDWRRALGGTLGRGGLAGAAYLFGFAGPIGTLLAAVCVGGFVGLTVWDLVDAGYAPVRRARRRAAGRTALALVPWIPPRGAHGGGLMVVGRF